MTLGPLALALHALLALVPVLTLLAIGAILPVAAWTMRGIGFFRSGWSRLPIRRRCGRGFTLTGRSRGLRGRLLRTLRTAGTMRAPLGPPARPPDLDEGRFLCGLRRVRRPDDRLLFADDRLFGGRGIVLPAAVVLGAVSDGLFRWKFGGDSGGFGAACGRFGG